MTVPYAFYSQYSGNGLQAGQGINITNSVINNTGDPDNSPTNELNTALTLGPDFKLRLTDAGGTLTADLAALSPQNLSQLLALGNDAGAQKIANLGSPTLASDAATKGYVDLHNDADASPTNEIQDLALTANTLRITNNAAATPINLASYLDNTDSQTLSLAGANLSISGGNNVNLSSLNTDSQSLSLGASSGTSRTINISGGAGVTFDIADNDNNPSNEIQDLTLTSNILKITNNAAATNINLSPYLDNTDAQSLSLSGSNLSITGGNTISLSSINTDAQNLALGSVSGTLHTINISGGTGITLDVADNDNNPTNEIQDLSLTSNVLKITNNVTATNINLAPYLDNTDNQLLTYTPATNNLSISSGNNVTITQTLAQVLTAGNDAGARKITNLQAPTANTDATTKKYVDDADAVLASRISTTYAFKTAFAYTNGGSIVQNDQTIPFTTEDFDDFNVLSAASFTAAENGTYVFMIDGTYGAISAGGQLSFLVAGVKYPVAIVQPWGGTFARYNATMMFKLTVGQTVSLVGDNILVGGQFAGSFFGYKL